MAYNTILHPRDRLPQEAPIINLEQGCFFISREEYLTRIVAVSCDLERIKDFCKFTVKNYHKIIARSLIYGDIQVFSTIFEK